MAVHSGKDGAVMIGGSVAAHIDSWSLDLTGDLHDVTSFTEKDRTFVPGVRNATASISGHYESTGAGQSAIMNMFKSTGTVAATTAVLIYHNTAGSKKGWKGTAYMSGVTVNGDVGSKFSFSANLQISGGVSAYTTT